MFPSRKETIKFAHLPFKNAPLIGQFHFKLFKLDFAKAFDKVPHQRLIHKLAQYGFQNKMLNWIKAFLSNRRQRVVLGDWISSWTHVFSGVPQGSVLGPTLFIIYINDLPDKLINPNEIYTDDTKIFCKINKNNFESDSKKLQTDINYIVNWTCI